MRNTDHTFGFVSVTFHWITFLSVFGLFGLGYWMVDLGYYSSWYTKGPDIHRSAGLCLLLWVLLSLAWRIFQIKPVHLDSHTKFEQYSGSFMHQFLSLTLVLVLISGYLISTADGRGIIVFSLFEVPGFGSFVDNQEDKSGLVHRYAAYILIIAAIGHGTAALKHHFVDKDDTLKRMILLSRK